MKTYNYDETLAMLEEVINEAGEDFVYERHDHTSGVACLYAHQGEPDCIVGHVFAKVGVPIKDMTWQPGVKEDFTPKAGKYSFGSARVVALRLERDGVARFTLKARCLLGAVQGRQDDQSTWGASLEHGIDYVSEMTEEQRFPGDDGLMDDDSE